MSIADLYNLIEKMQNTIGCDCRVSVFLPMINVLAIQVDWITNEQHVCYRRAYSAEEFRYIGDLDFAVDWFCAMAIREHKLKTVGEE